jgi:hypothetical protein
LKKVENSGRARCPTYEESMIYITVGRALPPLTGSAYGMTSPAKVIFQRFMNLYSGSGYGLG